MAKPPAKVDLEALDADPESLADSLTPLFRPDKVEEGRQVISLIVSRTHQGPLPPPELLHGYEQALPGAAERIVAMAEREQAHRHTQEARMIGGEYRTRWSGQAAMIIAIIVLGLLVAYCVHEKQPLAAGVIAAIGVVAGTILRYTQQKGEKEEEEPPKKPPAKRQRSSRKK